MLTAHSQGSDQLKPFVTDYCTLYAEGTRTRPGIWKHCCLEHDLYFWAGGSRADREETDVRLRKCVEATGEVTQARLLYQAVSLGGFSPFKFPSMYFGNGWGEQRPRYRLLTPEEIEMLIREVNKTLWLPDALKDSFIQQLNSRLE